jgi:hypothetical protein
VTENQIDDFTVHGELRQTVRPPAHWLRWMQARVNDDERLPGIVRMEDAFVEMDKRIYFGLVEDGCGWIENRLDLRFTRAACAAIRMLSAAANDLTHLRETIVACCR